MLESVDVAGSARNLSIYAVGVGAAVAGALGLAEAITLPSFVSIGLFVVGISLVLVVHEYLGGPV